MTMSRRAALSLASGALLSTTPVLADPIVTARLLTSAEPRCRAASGDDIVVCGRRDADRYRVPFDGYPDGDPRNETVSGERNRLASAPPVKCGIAAFLANCGSVGVSFSVGLDGTLRYRKLAP